jgi:arabinose-5-phosphate isomerase
VNSSLDPSDTVAVLTALRRVVAEEGEALVALSAVLGEPYAEAVRWMADCPGRILVSGLGKSGIVARKIAATLTGTGTPALFVHPVEALHGDLGIASADDLLLAISRSGGNEEIMSLVASLAVHGVRSIGLTAESDSALGRRADLLLHTPMKAEACPLGLSPTTSTTLAVVVGDALAMALLELRGFRPEDFAVLHPSGALGRGLRMSVAELMHTGDELPFVRIGDRLRDAAVEISGKRLGCTCVLDADDRLVGFISDGDFRRILLEHDSPLDLPVEELMSTHPVTVDQDCLARVALRRMETNEPGPVTQLVVTHADRAVGILHIHDVLRVGIRTS